jgi:hypothetical protein
MYGWAEDSMREAVDVLARSGRNELASDLNRILVAVDFDDLEVLRCPGSERIADEILEASSCSELAGLLGRLAEALGFNHCTLHVVSEAMSTNFTTKVLTTYSEEWIARYVNRRYSFIDPVGRTCLAAERGFFWDSLDHSALPLRSFWADAAAHGVGPSGFTMPITSERGDKIAVSVCSTEATEQFHARIQHSQSDLFNLGIFLCDAFCRLASDGRPSSFQPSDDQLTILRAIGMGVDEAELSQRKYQYGSYRTLERSICGLFRTKTVAQAAVLAARIGLLADAPLTAADILATARKTAADSCPAGPSTAPLRRLARLRNPSPEPEDLPLACGEE